MASPGQAPPGHGKATVGQGQYAQPVGDMGHRVAGDQQQQNVTGLQFGRAQLRGDLAALLRQAQKHRALAPREAHRLRRATIEARGFGHHDLDNLDTLMEAGLGFTADFEKRDGFVGMERTLEQKASGPPARRLVQVLLHDPQPLMHHGEIVYRNGEIVGEVRSASYGHSLGGAVGLSMVERTDGEGVTAAWIREGAWEVDVAGVRYPAKASLRPLYDPRNERIKL